MPQLYERSVQVFGTHVGAVLPSSPLMNTLLPSISPVMEASGMPGAELLAPEPPHDAAAIAATVTTTRVENHRLPKRIPIMSSRAPRSERNSPTTSAFHYAR